MQSGRLDEALAVAEEGLLFGEGSAEHRVRLVLAAASVERLLGRHEAARRRLVRAVDEPSVSRASWPPRSAAALAISAYERGEYDELASWAEGARRGDGLVGAAASLDAGARSSLRRAASTRPSRSRPPPWHVVRDATDDELAVHAELMIATAWSLVAVERLDDALLVSRRASGAALRAGNGAAAVPLLLAEVLSLGLLGRTEEAAEVSDRAEVEARLTRNDQSVQWALWMRAWVLLEHGDLDAALRGAEESVALARTPRRSRLWSRSPTRCWARSCWPPAGRSEAEPLIAAYDVEPGWVCRWATSAWSRHGSRSVTSRVRRPAADRAAALADGTGLAGAVAAAQRAGAMVLAARGRGSPRAPSWPGAVGGAGRVDRRRARRGARPICWPAEHSAPSTRRQRSRT